MIILGYAIGFATCLLTVWAMLNLDLPLPIMLIFLAAVNVASLSILVLLIPGRVEK
jgi:hypothetical protein